MDPVISLPLGAVDLTPLELAGAYATFANYGWHSDPTLIVQVTDSRGNTILDNTPKPQLLLDPWASAALTDVLQGVISQGTATNAQIGRPAAGKNRHYRLAARRLVCRLRTSASNSGVGR